MTELEMAIDTIQKFAKLRDDDKTRQGEESIDVMVNHIGDLEAENAILRGKLKELSGDLNRIRASIDTLLWPSSGFASVK